MTRKERVTVCRALRERAARSFAAALDGDAISELEFVRRISNDLLNKEDVHSKGWYDPPPGGTAALFGRREDGYARLLFDTLRKEEYWPKEQYVLGPEGAGTLYASPVDKNSGTIGDFGCTIYPGEDKKICDHLVLCLEVVEKTAEFAAVGMEFREVHNFSQELMEERGLNNSRTVTYTDNLGTNIGHTVPWSYEDPSPEEGRVIARGDFMEVKDLISAKRIYLNREEEFKIPGTIAFTTELRMESSADLMLPNVFFHIIVSFVDGEKTISGNFEPVFKALGMDSYIISKY